MTIVKRAIAQKGKSLDPCGKIQIAKIVIIPGDKERKSKFCQCKIIYTILHEMCTV